MEPRVLFKYGSWRSSKTKENIRNCSVFFCSPDKTNDPFEARVFANYEAVPYDFMRQFALRNPNLIGNIVDELGRRGRNVSKEQVLEFTRTREGEAALREALRGGADEGIVRQRNRSIGILALTPIRDSVLMWSHYSDNHKGFCIGYSVPVLSEAFRNVSTQDRAIQIRHVRYSGYPDLKAFAPQSLDWAIDQFATKASEWSYEQEIRFLMFGKSNEVVPIPSGSILEVIFGYWSTDVDKREIRESMERIGAKPGYLKVTLKQRQFGLDIERI